MGFEANGLAVAETGVTSLSVHQHVIAGAMTRDHL
jgi:hypothetical protein